MKKAASTPSKQLPSPPKKMYEVLVIRTGQKIAGHINTAEHKLPMLEGQINMAKWSIGTAYAVHCARVIEQVNKLDQQTVICSQRLAQVGVNELEAQIVLQTTNKAIDVTRTRSAVALLSKKVAAQSSLLELPIVIEDPTVTQFIEEQAQIFLQARGGQPLTKQIELVIQGESLAVVSGAWASIGREEVVKSRVFKLNCFYDGRRLRSRTLFLVEANTTGKKYAVNYDESKFDALIRSFQDNKDTALVATIEELTQSSGEITLILANLERVSNLHDFKLESESSRPS